MQQRVVSITLGFANPETLAASMRRLKSTTVLSPEIFILDQHYPLPDHDTTYLALRETAKEVGATVLDAGENLGLAGGFNYAMKQIGLAPDDIVIGYDPDSWPDTYGWDKALVEAFADPRNVWASLENDVSFGEMLQRGFTQEMLGARRIRVPTCPVVNSVCAWRAGWLQRIGGLAEPKKFYGGLEMTMWRHLNQSGGARWVFVEGAKEARTSAMGVARDEAYTEYKWRYAHVGDVQCSFAEFLDGKKSGRY